jgi:hypothetical protein
MLTHEEEKALVILDTCSDVQAFIGFDLLVDPEHVRIEGTDEITPDTIRHLHEMQLIYIGMGRCKGMKPGERDLVLSPGGRQIARFLQGQPTKLYRRVQLFYYQIRDQNWCLFEHPDGRVRSSDPTAWGKTPEEALEKFNNILYPKGIGKYDSPLVWQDVEVVGLVPNGQKRLTTLQPGTDKWFEKIIEQSVK